MKVVTETLQSSRTKGTKTNIPQAMCLSKEAKGNRSLIEKVSQVGLIQADQQNQHKPTTPTYSNQAAGFDGTVISQAGTPAMRRNSNLSHFVAWRATTMHNLEREPAVQW